jgi:hypothetical protein
MQTRETKIARKIQLGTSAESEMAAAKGRTAFTIRHGLERDKSEALTTAAQVPPISATRRLPLRCHVIITTDAAAT